MHAPTAFRDGAGFREIFFEEVQEHLNGTEAILLRLDPTEPYPDDLNAIFRAVHSIKGSAAMLGYDDVAELTHVFENLLDVLRKGERGCDKADVDAMLAAGDVIKSQVAHHQGLSSAAPDDSQAKALLRERVASGRASADAPPASRSFSVRLGPLAAPIEAADLELMMAGLGEMGSLQNQTVDNTAGGYVRFDLSLAGTEVDLRSVLTLVVPAQQVAVEALQAPVLAAAAKPAPEPAGEPEPKRAEQTTAALLSEHDEVFVDPEEFKRRRRERSRAAPTLEGIDLFVTPEGLKSRRPAPGDPAQAAGERGVPAPDRAASPAPAGGASIRVGTDKIDLLVNLVGELVITESMLSRQSMLGEMNLRGAGLKALADLTRHTRNLQEAVLAIRMLPLASVFARFPRLVRELSERLGKRVELKTSGESTELDRALIERISDPLTHLLRNAIDHGLETPQERAAAGKPPVGTISLAASQRDGRVVIEVSDDGRGLDRARILARAARSGIAVAADAPDAEVWRLIWEAGFSTAERVTDLSGRGVGMDVVRRNIQSLGGAVDIDSRPGKGMKVSVSVPLTLAIMEAMTIAVGGQTYVLPLSSVVESRQVLPGEIHVLPGGRETLRVRGDYLPVLRLTAASPSAPASAETIAVIVQADGVSAALVVDELPGQQQVVVKSLESNFRKVPGISGATIMGDGSVALILDVAHLTKNSDAVFGLACDRALALES